MFMGNAKSRLAIPHWFKRLKCLVFDIDGVLINGNTAIPGATRTFNALSTRFKTCVFTNNSTKTKKAVAEKLSTLGFSITEDRVITSGYLAALYCRTKGFRTFFHVGESGISEEMKAQGLKFSNTAPDVVVAGLDRNINYPKLSIAITAILQGSKFIATNTDRLLPLENGFAAGGGAIIGAIQGGTGKKPTVVGKPNTFGIRIIAEKFKAGKRQIAVIGDRYYTDIKMAKDFGCKAILVRSGIDGEPDSGKGKYEPDLILKDLEELAGKKYEKKKLLKS